MVEEKGGKNVGAQTTDQPSPRSFSQGRAEWPDPLNPPALDATGLGALEVS